MKLKRNIFKLNPNANKKIKLSTVDLTGRKQKALKTIDKLDQLLRLSEEGLKDLDIANKKADEFKDSFMESANIEKDDQAPDYPFDMLKPASMRNNSKRVSYGTFDFETITVSINAFNEAEKKFLLDTDNDRYNLENSLVSRSFIDTEKTQAIHLPIAYSIVIQTGPISSASDIENNTLVHSEIIPQKSINIIDIVKSSCNLMSSFFKEVKRLKDNFIPAGTKLYLYAHNAGSFDSYLVKHFYIKLEMRHFFNKNISFIKKKSDYLSLKIGKNLEFRDSIQLLSGSLQSLGDKIVKMGKKEMPTKQFTFDNLAPGPKCLVSPEMMDEYVRWDSILLFHILFTLEEFLQTHFQTSFYEKLTISSLTVLIYFRHYYKPELIEEKNLWNNAIFTLTKEQNDNIRASYHGGRTEVFKPHIGPGRVFDINSAYVAAMMNKPLPMGRGRGPYKIHDSVGFYNYELDSFFGFAEAEVFSPPDLLKPKALPFTSPNKFLTFPCGNFNGWFFSEELKMAKRMGYLIKVKNVIYFNRSKSLFKTYLENLSDIRRNYDKSHPYNDMAKRLGNALYGRFAMRTEDRKFLIAYSDKEFGEYIDTYHIKKVHTIKTVEDNTVLSFEGVKDSEVEDEDLWSTKFRMANAIKRTAPQISAAISSWVRMDICEVLWRDVERNIAYVDTDSAMIEGDKFPYTPDPKTPGAWKDEGEFKEAYIFAPKFYILIKEPLENIPTNNKVVIRGLSPAYKKEVAFEDLLKFHNKDPFKITIKGDIEKGKFGFQPDKYNFSMQVRAKPSTLSSTTVESMCTKVFNSEGVWIKTEPLIFVDGYSSDMGRYLPIYIKEKLLFDNYKKEISKSTYFKKNIEIRKYQKNLEALDAFISDPTNLPGTAKIDKKTGYYKKKTNEEHDASYILNLEKYKIIQDLKILKDQNLLKTRKELKLLEQLEVMVDEFKIANKCSDDDILSILKDQKAKRILQSKQKIDAYVASQYDANKSLMEALNIPHKPLEIKKQKEEEI